MESPNSYSTNNYSALNKAIQQEAVKQENLNTLTKTVRTAYMIACAVGVFLLILIILAIYKLFTHEFTAEVVEKPVIVEKPTVVTPDLDYDKLGQVLAEYAIGFTPVEDSTLQANNESPEQHEALSTEREITRSIDTKEIENSLPEDEKPFIETSFTVFHNSTAPSGESIVTGKEYSPENLLTPSRQYCYIHVPQGDSNIQYSVINLAIFEDDQINYYTEDGYYNSLADDYCLFK